MENFFTLSIFWIGVFVIGLVLLFIGVTWCVALKRTSMMFRLKVLGKYFIFFPEEIRENIRQQSKSGWFNKDKSAVDFLQKNSRELIEFANKNKKWCYLTSFERMFDKENIKKMFGFIGCSNDYNEAVVTEVINNNIKD